MFWVISVYFNIRNTLPKSGTFLLGHPVYNKICVTPKLPIKFNYFIVGFLSIYVLVCYLFVNIFKSRLTVKRFTAVCY